MRYSALATAALFCAASCLVAGPAIGTTGQTELTEGTHVQTASAPGDLTLESGVTVRLSSRSSGIVFSDHLVLASGSARIGNFGDYTVDAKQLEIQSQDRGAQAVVRLTGKTVEVASLGGSLKVTDGGAMLTRVAAGTRVSFQQTGAAPAQTGAASVRKRLPSDEHIMVWMIGVSAAAALAIGLTAAAQGKSPF